MDDLSEIALARVTEILAFREKYLAAWIAETGILPSEARLVIDVSNPRQQVITVQRRETTPTATVPADDPIDAWAELLEEMAKLSSAIESFGDNALRRRWENQLVAITGDVPTGLNKAGEEGWEPWAIVERRQNGQVIVAMKRPAPLIFLAHEKPS
jgi:hypothetical protein